VTHRNLVGKVLADAESKRRVESILDEQKKRARQILEENRDVLFALRDALLERDELVGEEIGAVIVESLEARRLAAARSE
jgi:ATP-dependent Zn protease